MDRSMGLIHLFTDDGLWSHKRIHEGHEGCYLAEMS